MKVNDFADTHNGITTGSSSCTGLNNCSFSSRIKWSAVAGKLELGFRRKIEMTEAQERALALKEDIEKACIRHNLNLTIYEE